MKTFTLALAASLMFGGAALADGNAVQSNAMSNSAMSSNAMAPAKPAHKAKAKKPAKTNAMSGQGSMGGPNNAMSGQNGNAMSGDNMSAPAKPH